MTSIEHIAIEIRTQVRAKANLKPDWDKASEGMRVWYRHMAEEWAKGHAPETEDKTPD